MANRAEVNTAIFLLRILRFLSKGEAILLCYRVVLLKLLYSVSTEEDFFLYHVYTKYDRTLEIQLIVVFLFCIVHLRVQGKCVIIRFDPNRLLKGVH